MDTANRLPASSLIVPYYRSLGFDLPLFIELEHGLNGKTVYELGLAAYSDEEQILAGQNAFGKFIAVCHNRQYNIHLDQDAFLFLLNC